VLIREFVAHAYPSHLDMIGKNKFVPAALITIDLILAALPAVAIFLIRRQFNIYEFRTLLTEKIWGFILLIGCIAIIPLFVSKIDLRVRIVLIVVSCLGIYLYLSLYDSILTY
jgi:hypothetical protein